CAVMFFPLSSFSQNNFFESVSAGEISSASGKRLIIPSKFNAVKLDHAGMKNFLWSLPNEQAVYNNRLSAPVLELPMPDGNMARFHVWESSIQEQGLEAVFPEIKTFAGQGI